MTFGFLFTGSSSLSVFSRGVLYQIRWTGESLAGAHQYRGYDPLFKPWRSECFLRRRSRFSMRGSSFYPSTCRSRSEMFHPPLRDTRCFATPHSGLPHHSMLLDNILLYFAPHHSAPCFSPGDQYIPCHPTPCHTSEIQRVIALTHLELVQSEAIITIWNHDLAIMIMHLCSHIHNI